MVCQQASIVSAAFKYFKYWITDGVNARDGMGYTRVLVLLAMLG